MFFGTISFAQLCNITAMCTILPEKTEPLMKPQCTKYDFELEIPPKILQVIY